MEEAAEGSLQAEVSAISAKQISLADETLLTPLLHSLIPGRSKPSRVVWVEPP